MRGTFSVVAGPFSTVADAQVISDATLRLRAANDRHACLGLLHLPCYERLPSSAIASVEIAHEESAKSFAGSAVAGIAGGLLLGPVGAIAGALAGGNRSLVTFVLTLSDGRRALCTAKSPAFRALQAAAFQAANPAPPTPAVSGRLVAARFAVFCVLVGGLAGSAWWFSSSLFSDAEQAHYEADLANMRRNFPNLSEEQLRARVDEGRR